MHVDTARKKICPFRMGATMNQDLNVSCKTTQCMMWIPRLEVNLPTGKDIFDISKVIHELVPNEGDCGLVMKLR